MFISVLHVVVAGRKMCVYGGTCDTYESVVSDRRSMHGESPSCRVKLASLPCETVVHDGLKPTACTS